METQYIGARYVPKFYENSHDPSSMEWESGKGYEALVVVTWNDDTYTSKKPVPSGIGNPASNPTYWAKTGNFNAALEAIQEELSSVKNGGLNDNVIEYSKFTANTKKIVEGSTKAIFMPNTVLEPVASGNGACTVFVTRVENKVVMFDSGKSADYSAIKGELIKNNITHIDYFILSHYHGDHWGNAVSLQNDGYIDNNTVAYLPRDTNAVSGWDVAQAQVRSYFANNEVVTISSDAPLIVDGLRFDFFNCDADVFAHYETSGATDGNTYSIFSYVSCEAFTLFMGGDIDSTAIAYNASLGTLKHANVMNLPHHGINSGSYTDLIMLVQPEVALFEFAAGGEYKHDNYTDGSGHYGTSNKVALLNALGVDTYSSGYGAIYLGIGSGEYTLIGNDKPVKSYRTQYLTLYLNVDASYEGLCYGTVDKPFNSIEQALAYVNDMKLNTVIINVVGAYNYPTEVIDIANTSTVVHIRGSIDDDALLVNVGRFNITNSTVILQNIGIKNNDTNSGIHVVASNVYVNGCVIDGNTSALTNVYEGCAVTAERGSSVILNKTEISNRRTVVYNMSNSVIDLVDCTGSGNVCLVSGANGFKSSIRGAGVGYTTMFNRRYNSVPSADFIEVNNAYNFCNFAPFTVYADSVSADKTETIDLSSREYYNKIFRVYSSNGAIYEFVKTSGNLSTPTLVQNSYDASDPSLAVSTSGNTLTITYSAMIKVVAI